jgi:signal peptidase I
MLKAVDRQSSIITLLVSLLFLFLAWVTFAPTQLGGPVTYVIVDGNSMEPGFHLGDLLLVRKEPSYQVGDAVTYQNAELERYVFHRIIKTEFGRYILKGDNNPWIDSYYPSQNEIIGKLWIHLPKLGLAVKWIRIPLHMGLITGLLGGLLMISLILKSPEDKNKTNQVPALFLGKQEFTAYVLGAICLVFLALSIISFTRPLNRTADGISYQQSGSFFYSAAGTPGIYDTDTVRSGEPIFPKLTCFLNVGFTYNLLGLSTQQISGTHQLYARILDEQSGWQRTIQLKPETAFNGSTFFTAAAVDICQVNSLVGLVEQETGLHPNTYTLEIIDHTVFTANLAGIQATDTFDPSLVFKFDKAHFYLESSNGKTDPLNTIKEGMAGNPNLQANTFSILGIQVPVWVARMLSLLGFAFFLIGLSIIGANIYKETKQDQEALTKFKYGSILVDVYERNLTPTSVTIDVTSMDDLARLAERHGTMILHMVRNFLHYYLVQSNGTTFRYVVSTGKRGVNTITATADVEKIPATPLPLKSPVEESPQLNPSQPVIVFNHKQNDSPPELDKVKDEVPVQSHENNPIETKKPAPPREPEYIIQTGRIEFISQPETEMLKKIRL